MHTLVVFQQTNQLYHHIIRNSKSKLFSKIKKPAGGLFQFTFHHGCIDCRVENQVIGSQSISLFFPYR